MTNTTPKESCRTTEEVQAGSSMDHFMEEDSAKEEAWVDRKR